MRQALAGAFVLVLLAGCGDSQDDPATAPQFVQLNGMVPGGLITLLGSDAEVATGYGCISRVPKSDDPATSSVATKCTIKFGEVKREFVRGSGGEWQEVDP